MTRDQIVAQVAARLNLTSTVALARIADDVTECYRQVLGSIGMPTSSQGVVTSNTVIAYRYVTFTGVQKLLSVFNSDGQVLGQRTVDEIRNLLPGATGTPLLYAISGQTANTVTIFLNTTPTAIETLSADALVDTAVLTANDEPVFPAIYHDLLVYGAKAIELDKMEKPDLAQTAKGQYETRLGELRFFLAKSAYLHIYQGRNGPYGYGPWWQGF